MSDRPAALDPREVARRITLDLFTNGQGDKAERLVMLDADGKDLGGWSPLGMASRIAGILWDIAEDES